MTAFQAVVIIWLIALTLPFAILWWWLRNDGPAKMVADYRRHVAGL